MDRRRFDREPTNLELYAEARKHRRQRLRVQDISTNGVFVEGWAQPPAQGTPVSLTFIVGPWGRVVKLLRREATVARVTEDGVGLVHGSPAQDASTAHAQRNSPWSSLRWPQLD